MPKVEKKQTAAPMQIVKREKGLKRKNRNRGLKPILNGDTSDEDEVMVRRFILFPVFYFLIAVSARALSYQRSIPNQEKDRQTNVYCEARDGFEEEKTYPDASNRF